ncbi:zf-TFIIB domain-containing protein [Brevundimonas sp.]|uniref:TFIIB-type zinc ribbon-containing protein n=1 Tax=Brevundimonas sp. TaxID=1871086 RepID=UPI003AF9F35C
MPLLMCPNDNAAMQTLERSGVQFDMCPTCRGVWLDRGELEKLMAAAVDEGRATAPAAQPQPQPQPPAWSAPSRAGPFRDDRYRDDRRHDDRGRPRKKKRDSIFDIFEFD